MRFNVTQLVADCGGAAALAEAVSVSRTTPYRWMKQGSLSSRVLEKIKDAYPLLRVDDYFGEAENERTGGNTGGGGT